MSLYADEDLALPSSSSSAPLSSLTPGSTASTSALAGTATTPLPSATTSGTASGSGDAVGPSDPLQALAAALTLPAETAAQADALIAAGKRFEEHPERLPELCAQLLPMVVDGGESLLRSWTLEMVGLAVGRSALQGEVKIQVAQSSLEALNRLLHGPSPSTIKAVIPIFATIHPILFKLLASSRPPHQIFELFQSSKTRIVALTLDPSAQPQNVGVKAAGWKFIQRVMLAGTRAAAADPRLHKRTANDPNVNIITHDSPVSAPELEEEAILLRNQLVSQLFTLSDPAVLHPIIQCIPVLCKSRPTLAPAFITSLTSWTPAALEAKGRSAMEVRAVEKTLRMVMAHLLKHPPLSNFSAQLNDALFRQKGRLEIAFSAEQDARRQRRAAALAISADGGLSAAGKRPAESEAESSAQAAKRARMEVVPGSAKGKGVEVDISGMDLETVVEVVMRGLEVVSPELIAQAFQNARRNLEERNADAIPVLAALLGISAGRAAYGDVKDEDDDEVLNPLEMDIDDEDDLMMNEDDEALDEAITFADFSMPPPASLEPDDKASMVKGILERIWTSGSKLASLPDGYGQRTEGEGVKPVVQPKEMWMLLLARLGTRGGEVGRKEVAEFITADFAARSKFAAIWLNEEWYVEKMASGSTPTYNAHLDSILTTYLPTLDAKDKSLSTFLTSLPSLPLTVIDKLETLCEDTDRSIVGFLALRDLCETRPPVRAPALKVLLQLCTHPDRKTRVLAISTVRRWVPESAMAAPTLHYALGVLRRLVSVKPDGMEVEEGEQAEEVSESKFLTEVSPQAVQQHVELAFALSRRQQNLLDDIFRLYPLMAPDIQESVETLLTPLIQSLGPTEKLVSILRDFPPGADKLVLRTVTVLSAEGSTGVVRDLVKVLMDERDLDPRFIIPIIGTLDKAEIEKQIPRIVSLLATPSNRDVVRNAFASILQKLTPADLLVILHVADPESTTGLKPTIEAIGICFSMTTVFRSDVLATAMSRIADTPELPLVFMRTVIQAVTTYKSLVPFVANTVLPKMVNKKIWTNPQLWDGFVRLSKLIAPASFGTLLQLPKEWLRNVLDKQPGLRQGLKAFLGSKPQTRGVMMEIFGEEA